MNLNDVFNGVKARKRHKRVGRGAASGWGKTSGRGDKGLGSRTGGNYLRGFVGGQTQLKARLPKRGFNNAVHTTIYAPINIEFLEQVFDAGDVVDLGTLQSKGAGLRRGDLVKILARGELTKKLVVKANAISASAREKIEKAGGTVEILAADNVAAKLKSK